MITRDAVVRLYARRDCAQCEAARAFLRGRGVAFVEIDVMGEAGAIAELARLTGQATVPTITLGGDVQVGWDESRVAEMVDDPLPPEEEDPLLAFIEKEAETRDDIPPDPEEGL